MKEELIERTKTRLEALKRIRENSRIHYVYEDNQPDDLIILNTIIREHQMDLDTLVNSGP